MAHDLANKKNNGFYALACLLLLIVSYLTNDFIEQNKRIIEEQTVSEVIPEQALEEQVSGALMSVDINISDFVLPSPKTTPVFAKVNGTSSYESSETDVEQQLQAMTELNGDALQLKFPSSINKTETILHFMHKCIGIDLAAYTGQNLIMLKQKQSAHSPLLRIASGHLTKVERSLLDLYASQYRLARLYPVWFDMRLSRQIHEHLMGANLRNFSGIYKLEGQTLWLQNIRINGQKIEKNWLMADANHCK